MNTLSPEISAVISGQVLPVVIDMVNRYVPSSRARFWVSVLFCFFFGILLHLPELQTLNLNDGVEIFKIGSIIFTSSQSAYKTYYERSQIHHRLRNPN